MELWKAVLRGAFLVGVCVTQVVAQTDIDSKPAREITVAAVGDIMLGGTATQELAIYGYDYPFEHVGGLLRIADIAFGNLEGPLTQRGDAQAKKYTFRSPPDRVAPALARVGFDVLSLANNHSMDYGVDGLHDTMQALREAGIRHVGAGDNLVAAREPIFFETNGGRVAFLAYSLTFPEEFWANDNQPGTAFGHEHQVRADVAAAKGRADVVLVSFHWGVEGSTELRDYQRKLGHAAVEAGAAVVIGHHPHILQGIERYREGIILYSLGNFVFGSYSNDATRSAIAVMSIRGGQVKELKLHPINVKNAEVVFQPRMLTGNAAAAVIEQLNRMSQPLGVTFANDHGVAVFRIADNNK